MKLKSIFVIGTHVDIWPGPPFMYLTGLPICRVSDGTLALVLETDINSYKVFVAGTVGWVDKADIDGL